MVVAGRRRSIAFFISLGAGLICVILIFYFGWVLLGTWHHPILLTLGVLLSLFLIGGVALNTAYLVREIRRNEHQDAFINAVTHELKTPVASIRLYLETLQARAVEEDRRKEFYNIMLEDSDRLLQTIEQILRAGRIGAASRKPNLARIDLSGVVAECVDRARALHHVPEGALRYQAGDPMPVLADPDEVRAAVSNLLDNAVKYSGQNVRVAVETSLEEERNFVAVRVRDQGAGIPSAELKRIFKRFHRAPGSGGKRVPGTGLGLYIVRSVAKRHGGKAWAESEGPGHGSTFVFQIPAAS